MDPVKYEYVSKVDGLKDWYFVHDAGENTACVVYLHGHGSHGDQPFTRKDLAAILLPMFEKYDLSIISFNLRDNAWMSRAAVTDLREQLLECRREYRFSRYIFIAGSMGGTGALIFASQYPELIDGIIIGGAATDIGRYREYCRTNTAHPVLPELFQAIDEHYAPEDYEAYNVCTHFEKLTMPIVFYHGIDDPVMPVSEMTSLQEKMKDFPNAYFKAVPGTHDAPLAYIPEMFEKLSGLRDFSPVYQRESSSIFPGAPNSIRNGYNLYGYYAGKYFEQHPANDTPECIVHARALDYALQRLPLDFPEDQLFFGGVEQFFYTSCPKWLDEEEYQKYYKITVARGLRSFRVGWDHAAPDYSTLMERGIGDFICRAKEAKDKLGTPESEAMLIALKAYSGFFRRAGEFWSKERPAEAERLRRLAVEPPQSFADGLQLMWLTFVVLESQVRFHMALARMDQYLYPLYQNDTIDKTTALNMLCHIFSKVEGFHEVTNICIGGVKPDGCDAVNDLSYLILKAVRMVHSASTNLSARLHIDSPDEFVMACAELISTGIGFPAIMNDGVYIPSLVLCGIPLEAARDYALFGCVEGNIPGRAPAWSDSRFNMSERFAEVMMQLEKFDSYEELWNAFTASMTDGLQKHLEQYDKDLRFADPAAFPDPLLSALTRDCIARGKDINAGGAEFPRQHGVSMIGPATIADSLAAVKKLVFEEKRISKSELIAALKNNFDGFEELRLTLINCAPKYGNDDPYVDNIMADIIRTCGEKCVNLRCCDGGFLRSAMASNVSNIACGAKIPATADGRFTGTPVSDAASPGGGMDRNGPTAFINSIITPDYSSQNCTVVNMRFLPEMFQEKDGCRKLAILLKRFITGGGHEIQFNVTNNQTLQDALDHPEKYGDLIVRVSGFSAFFTRLIPAVQQDIIRRNAHGR